MLGHTAKRLITTKAGAALVGAIVLAGAAVPTFNAMGSPWMAPAQPNPAPTIPRTIEGLSRAATSVDQLEKLAQEGQAELDKVSAAAAMATEKYNQAKHELMLREAQAQAAAKRALRASQIEVRSREQLHQWAASVYMDGGTFDGLEMLLAPQGVRSVTDRVEGAELVATYREKVATDATSSRVEAQNAKSEAALAQLRAKAAAAQAEKAHAAARAAVDAAAQKSLQIKAQHAALMGKIAQLRGTTIALEYQRLEGLSEAESRRLWERNKAAVEKKLGITITTYPTADTAAAAMAIAFARAQMGKPYLWGGEGPHAWDCSGLTQAAWRTAGRQLTHYTGSQWQETKLVPIAQAKPGDLVFYGQAPGNIHHVGLYIGVGKMIEAPRAGLTVRIASIYRSDLLPYVGRP